MKTESFIKLLRTIISEEVRKAVRAELNTALNENTNTKIPAYSEPKISLREKYRDVLGVDSFGSIASNSKDKVPLNKEGTPAIVNLSGNNLVNSILAETAQQMRQDPGSNAFFEGLR